MYVGSFVFSFHKIHLLSQIFQFRIFETFQYSADWHNLMRETKQQFMFYDNAHHGHVPEKHNQSRQIMRLLSCATSLETG